jgi:hypothetical protein
VSFSEIGIEKEEGMVVAMEESVTIGRAEEVGSVTMKD